MIRNSLSNSPVRSSCSSLCPRLGRMLSRVRQSDGSCLGSEMNRAISASEKTAGMSEWMVVRLSPSCLNGRFRRLDMESGLMIRWRSGVLQRFELQLLSHRWYWQSRIHAMSFRLFALAALVLFSAFAVFGCGVGEDGDAVSENALTAELVVPPASQESADPTATAVPPTATAVPPTATMEVAVESKIETAVEKTRVNVANRGYNSLGDPDAPITMFEFSDFL